MLRPPYPRDADSLSREVRATLKIKDIQDYYRQKERLAIKWWEFFIMALLFVAGLGFVVTSLYLLPPKNLQIYFRFLAFWSALLVLALIAAIEIILTKIRALYYLLSYQDRLLTELQQQLKAAGKTMSPAADDTPVAKEENRQ